MGKVNIYRSINGVAESSVARTDNAWNGGSGTYYTPDNMSDITGYTWNGYFYTDVACTEDNVFYSGVVTNDSMVLYAKYVPSGFAVTEYEVVNGTLNSTAIATETASASSNFTPTDISKSGYTLVGWYTDSSCSTAYTVTTWTAAGNLYAKYCQNYTVSEYRVVDGVLNSTAFNTESATYESVFTPTTPAAISGFTFGGWYTDSALSTAYDSRITPTGNFSLYAKFTTTSTSTFILALDVYTADFPSGYNTDNWSTAKVVYFYLWNSSMNSGLIASNARSADTGNFSLSVSTGWTNALFCLDSTFPASANSWRKTSDITLPTSKSSPTYYRLNGSTTATSTSTTTKITVSSVMKDRTIYARNVTTTTTPVSIIKAWNSASPTNSSVYVKSNPFTAVASGLAYTTWYFNVPSACDTFALANRVGSGTVSSPHVWYVTSAYTYAFNTVDSNNPAVLSISAAPSSTLDRPTCNWLSCRQVTNSDASYTSIPLPSQSFFRFWIARPSTAFGANATYEDGYLWTLVVNNGGTATEILPKGYVIDSKWTGSSSTPRIFSFYDVPVAYTDFMYKWICRSSSATNGAALLFSSAYSSTSIGADQITAASICYLAYSGTSVSYTSGSCSYSSVTLVKTVLQGYFTCLASNYNGYGAFSNVLSVWFKQTSDYDKVAITANTFNSTGSATMQANTVPDYANGTASYSSTANITAAPTLYAKCEKMRQLATGTSPMYGPIKTESPSSISTTLIIVGSSGAAGLLFIAGIYLFSRRKKKPLPRA